MKIGCNYSDVLIQLIDNNQVDIDAVKMGYFGPFLGLHDMVARRKQLLIHGFGWHEHIGMPTPDTSNEWDLMNAVMDKYGNDDLAVHFSIYEQDMVGRSNPREVLDQGLSCFKKYMNVPIMLENMDYNPLYNRLCVLKEAVDPGYIKEMCEKHDLQLLLDTAHASVSAYHLKMDVVDYLEQLPLSRVKEVHFIGTELTVNQGLKDVHTVLKDRDYELMDWLMPRIKPEMMTLEYGWPGKAFEWRTDKVAILTQLQEIRRRYDAHK